MFKNVKILQLCRSLICDIIGNTATDGEVSTRRKPNIISSVKGSNTNLLTFIATIFDALDTMLIMGLDTQYQKALGHVNDVNFKKSDSDSKTFETTIRYLGGLLSANDIKPNTILVKQAIAVAEDAIMPAFKNDGIPAAYVDVNT